MFAPARGSGEPDGDVVVLASKHDRVRGRRPRHGGHDGSGGGSRPRRRRELRQHRDRNDQAAEQREFRAEPDARDPVPVRPGDGEHGEEHARLHQHRLPVRGVHDRGERGECRDRTGDRRRPEYQDGTDRDRGEASACPRAPARDEQDEPADPDRRSRDVDEVRQRDQAPVVGVEGVPGQRRRDELEHRRPGGERRRQSGPRSTRARPQRRPERRLRRSRSPGRTGSRRRPARSPAAPARRPRSGSGPRQRPRSPADADRARAGRAR